MTINAIYYPHVLAFSTDASIQQEVARFDSVQFDPQYEMIQRMAGGDPYPCFVGAASSNPRISFTSPSIRPILQVCTDYDIVRDLQPSDVELSYRAGKPQSMRQPLSSALHFKVILQQSGMIYWDSLNARESEDVTISATIMAARSSAAINPWLNVGNEELFSPLCDSLYTLGPVIFNGRLLGAIHQINWQNNVRTYSRKTANNPKDPCYQSVHDFRPVVTAMTNDLSEMTHEVPKGVPAGGLDTYGGQQMNQLRVFFRRRRATGFYYEDNLPQHIELRCFGGWKGGTTIDGNEPAEGELQFHCSQAVTASGRVSSDFLLTKLIDTVIPNVDPTAAPSITNPGNQNLNVNESVYFTADTGTGGVPSSWSVDTLPAGLALNTVSGLISGAPTAPGTTNVTLTATNSNGSSPQTFDMIVS